MKVIPSQTIDAAALVSACEQLYQQGGRMQLAYAWYPIGVTVPEVRYLVQQGAARNFQWWCVSLTATKTLASLANVAPMMGWYEREMYDLFAIHFTAHPECYPLVLHDGVQSTLAPMDRDYPGNTPLNFSRQTWQLPAMQHDDLQFLPFGPVRAGVCESAQFLFLYAGESILHFNERLFFKHRGMEKRFETLKAELGVVLAERVSGVSSVAHVLAFCQAVEMACQCKVPRRAQQWRVILAECERLYNHLHYLGRLCHTTTLKVGEAQGHILEERLKQLNALVTGSRLLRGIITPGGLRREPRLEPLLTLLPSLQQSIQEYTELLLNTNTHIDRLLGTGVLTHQVALDEGATGPVARASGLSGDFRFDHPYAAYAEVEFTPPMLDAGDAFARMKIRIMELQQSFQMVQTLMSTLIAGPITVACHMVPDAEGLAWVESPRGGLFYAVHLDPQGKLARVKIKSPSFSNWRVFPFTVDESNMMDYAINEASFGSTVAGCDR